MFKKIKILLLKLFWSVLPNLNNNGFTLNLLDKIFNFFYDLKLILLPVKTFFLNFFFDLNAYAVKRLNLLWNLITKHRLLYIIRLLVLIFLLYKPTLIDLDSVYWVFTTVFYFFTNNFFFISSHILPFANWSLQSLPLKFFVFLAFFPALFSSRRFKRRVMKKNRHVMPDDDIIFAFQWAQRIFLYSSYFVLWYFSFLIFSIFLPLVFIYFSDFNFSLTTMSVYLAFLSDYKYLTPIFNFFYSNDFFFFGFYVLKVFYKFIYIFFNLYIFPFLFFIISMIKYLIMQLFYFFISFLSLYFFFLFKILKNIWFIVIFVKSLTVSWSSLSSISPLIDIFKNFLFSDNFVIFLFLILKSVFEYLWIFLSSLFGSIINVICTIALFFLPDYLVNWLAIHVSPLLDFFLIKFYSLIIVILDHLIVILNTYLKDITFFGFVSTWFEHLTHGLQRGLSQNSLLNWLFVHLYASIIAFWFLDFDFRVSVKTPPKTPQTLLKEAKVTQDWIPQSMDFLTLQTNEAKIYFAMLDISFQHVESLQFIYGDFEYIDEEYDMEDETPDEEELFNDSEETVKVREIIESDLGFTTRPHKMSDGDPLDSQTSLERHYLNEIVGEPELIYIEDSLKWMFASLYSPTFEELHYKDSLFSEWVFDPDEDLTFFEFILLFPVLFYCVYVWFFRRIKRKKNFRSYLRFFVPSRRLVFSGWWVEDFLGLPLGEWGRYFFDKMRHHTAPDVKFRSVHKFRMYRARQKFKLMQLEAFHFERLRLIMYKNTLKEWEAFTAMSIKFLAPNRHFHHLYSTVMQFRRETKDWAAFGDWGKFFFKPESRPERISFFFDSLQISLPRLVEKYINRRGTKKFRKNLWRTVQHIPGHLSMPYYPKKWYSRFSNTYLFFPSVETKYNYSYYNYIGWRDNRARWRRYAFTPGNVTDKVLGFNRSLQQRDYNLYKRWQKRRRLMRVFQF